MINGKQNYKCHACGRQFLAGFRLDPAKLWEEYSKGKQTYTQLAEKYNCSARTIRRKIDQYQVPIPSCIAREVIVLMDTTYWKAGFGLMLFRDSISRENLLKYYVDIETNRQYRAGIAELESRGYIIRGIVCDGRRGLLNSFGDIPVQMCQFHQAAIIRKYLTKRPRMPAAIELKQVSSLMKQTDRESFTGALKLWHHKWMAFLNERSVSEETGKSFYTHKRLRSAYRSLVNNLPWLFTWYDHMELDMPNTTNAIDGHFADLKNKLRNHNGLSAARKKKFIDEFLKA